MTGLCCLIRKVKMTKILVVGLAVILAAAGSGRADSTTGQSGTSATSGSAGSSGGGHSSGSAHSSGSGAVQQGAVAPARSSGSGVVRPGAVAPSNRSGSVPVVRQYPTNVNVQNGARPNFPANWRFQRPLDRSELLARQAFYYRNRVNPATVQGITQSTANTWPSPPRRANLRRHQFLSSGVIRETPKTVHRTLKMRPMGRTRLTTPNSRWR